MVLSLHPPHMLLVHNTASRLVNKANYSGSSLDLMRGSVLLMRGCVLFMRGCVVLMRGSVLFMRGCSEN